MPRLSPIRTSALEDLAEQLRFAPRATIRRQLDAIDRLAGEVEESGMYPEDWIVQRITGFRARMDEPAMVVGAALLGDLSALSEHLCAHARLGPGDMGEGAVELGELCRAWSVDRRTVNRYRRRGLIARRGMDDAGHTRLYFSPAALDAFRSREGDRLDRAGAFARLSGEERERIALRAARARREGMVSVSAAAREEAAASGRAHETVRRILLDYEVREGKEGRGALSAGERRAVYEAERRGERAASIAARFGRSRASVGRIAREVRAEILRRVRGELAALDLDDAALEAAIGAPIAARLGAGAMNDARELIEGSRRDGPIGAEDERQRSLAYRALVTRAAHSIDALPRFDPPAAALDRIEADLRWALRLKRVIMWTHRSLVVRGLEERSARGLLELPPDELRAMLECGFGALAEGIDRHDARRGGRLAAPVSLAIARALASVGLPGAIGPDAARRAAPEVIAIADLTARAGAWSSVVEPTVALVRAIGREGADERAALERHFGLTDAPPLTPLEIEGVLGIARRRFAGMLRRVRAAAAADPAG